MYMSLGFKAFPVSFREVDVDVVLRYCFLDALLEYENYWKMVTGEAGLNLPINIGEWTLVIIVLLV